MSRLLERFLRAVDGFDARVQAIDDDQWDRPTPCTEWSVRDLVNHLVYEDRWASPMLQGKTIDEVGDAFEGDLLGDDPKGAWKEASEEARAAASRPGALDGTVHASFGDIPAHQYLFQMFTDHVIHSWDLARAIGADERLDPELVDYLYEKSAPIEDELKGSGVFGDKVEPAAEADTQTKLLAIYGRRA